MLYPRHVIDVRRRRAAAALALAVGALATTAGVVRARPIAAAHVDAAGVANAAPAVELPAPFHTALEAAYPAADTVHTGEVLEIRLRFTTAVQPSLSTITLLGPGGPVVGVGEVGAVAGSEAHAIRVRIPGALPSGAYTVQWRTAGPDGHPVQGTYGFRVERPQAAPVAPASADTASAPMSAPVPVSQATAGSGVASAVAPVGLALRWLFFASVIAMIGLAAFRLAVAGAVAGAVGFAGILEPASRRARAWAWGVGAIAVALVPARLVLQAMQLFGAEAWRPTRLGALLESSWGAAWALHAAMTALFLAGVAWTGAGGRRARGWWLAAVAALGTPLAVALSGHAAAATPTTLAVLNDAAHVTAAGLWIGTLGCVLVIGLPALREGVSRPGAGEGVSDARGEGGLLPGVNLLVGAFSRLAVLAVGLLIVTGVVSAVLHLGGFIPLFTTPWGRTLLIKLGLVLPATGLGLYHWRVVRPRLHERPAARLFRVSATAELFLALAVLLVTAVLVALPRPGM